MRKSVLILLSKVGIMLQQEFDTVRVVIAHGHAQGGITVGVCGRCRSPVLQQQLHASRMPCVCRLHQNRLAGVVRLIHLVPLFYQQACTVRVAFLYGIHQRGVPLCIFHLNFGPRLQQKLQALCVAVMCRKAKG